MFENENDDKDVDDDNGDDDLSESHQPDHLLQLFNIVREIISQLWLRNRKVIIQKSFYQIYVIPKNQPKENLNSHRHWKRQCDRHRMMLWLGHQAPESQKKGLISCVVCLVSLMFVLTNSYD